MISRIILFFIIFLPIESFCQSPTFQALRNLNHNVDNNRFELKAKPTKQAISEKKSTLWTNVYFQYFKNPNIKPSQGQNDDMKFSIKNQFLYSIYFPQDTIFSIQLSKGSKDKLTDIDAVMFTVEGNKILNTKLKRKDYTLSEVDNNVKLQVNEGILKAGSFLQLIIEIESYNFKKFGPFDFIKPIAGEYDFILSTNIPDSFKYEAPEELELIDKKADMIKLKEFTNSIPPIIDYNATSHSYKWSVDATKSGNQLVFTLRSLKFERNIGTSVEQLMKSSE